MSPLDGQPTDALMQKWTVVNALATLETLYPEIARATVQHIKTWHPKDHRLFESSSSSGWVPARYMGAVANQALLALGEGRFSAYWVKTTLKHFDSGPLAGAFKVYSKFSIVGVVKVTGFMFGLASKNNGELSVCPGEDGHSAIITLAKVPVELLTPGHFVGLGAVWKAVLLKAGAPEVTVTRAEAGSSYVYHCKWKDAAG